MTPWNAARSGRELVQVLELDKPLKICDARRQWFDLLALKVPLLALAAPRQKASLLLRNCKVITNTQDRKTAYALGRSELSRVARAGNLVRRVLLTQIPLNVGG